MNFLDQPRSVRTGEELDAARLGAYLRENLGDVAEDAPIVVEQFRNGYSNLTYRVQFGDRELVLRRPPFGAQVKSGHDMAREYRVLSALAPVYPKVPRPVLFCDDVAVLGAPFYLMERVPGVILRATLPEGLQIGPDLMQRIATSFIENLAAIHALDWQQGALATLGHPAGYVQRQVTGWAERYQKAKTDDLPELERASQWLIDHAPPNAASALIHNDYKYDNLILDAADMAQIRAVLDWEMATLGDPLMDLGSTLAYWVDPDDPPEARIMSTQGSLTTLPGNPTRVELAQRYATASGRDLGDLVFYYTFGLFKNAVIAQQIYYRYKQGLTHDERFAVFLPFIQMLGVTAAKVITLQRIDRLG
jgi:aminoglycoside phosphotransferase (APT) family kinase protein